MVIGIDLVQAQLRIAAGEPIGIGQADIVERGHAIECRINAEDPADSFRPAPSQITAFRAPTGAGVRVDSAIYPGYRIPQYYDSLIAKLIAWGENREMARRRMIRALDEMVVSGPPTTIPFHLHVMQHHDFITGQLSTRFIDRLDLSNIRETPRTLPGVAITETGGQTGEDDTSRLKDARRFQIRVEGRPYTVEVAEIERAAARNARSKRSHVSAAVSDGVVRSPMHGVVIRIPIEVGANVTHGSVVCVIEAMKMENEVLAPNDGVVVDITVRPGDTVDANAKLMRVQPRA
jgi:acetyl-CoA/propionyl-CoA carboxylase biotin carboxyl carrier protein